MVSSGVIEVCVGFKVIVGLSLDEISISFRLISLTPLIEEADSNNLPIQSLEVVSVVLAKALGDPELEEIQIDSTTVKAHPVASTGRRQPQEKKRKPTSAGVSDAAGAD